ncbi:MAG: hypothetical protein U0441_01045 [Polyangiaceae bacterium]
MDKRSLLLGLGCLAFSFVIGCTGKITGGSSSGGGGAGGETGGSTTTTTSGGTGSCFDIQEGGYCANVGDTCTWDEECGGVEYTCEPDHTWSAIYYDELCCNEPVNDCPADMPKPGDPCDVCADVQTCFYDAPVGCTGQYSLYCDPDFWAWMVVENPKCVDDCGPHTDPADCNAQPYCRYFSTGCPGSQVPADGCYSTALPCSPDSNCPVGKTCTDAGDMDCSGDTCTCLMTSICL